MTDKKGSVLIFVFVIMVGLSGLALALLTMTGNEIRSSGAGLWNMQAFYIAEAGLAKARWALTVDGQVPGWSETDDFGEGTYTVTTTDNGDDTCTIVSDGYIPDVTNTAAKRRVIEQNIPTDVQPPSLSLTATASASSVKGKDTADKAIDGDGRTKWTSNVNNGSWLKLDFGDPITFNKIVVNGKKIGSYTIEYSNNDAAYKGVTNLVELPAWTCTFDSVAARYLRFSLNGKRPEVNELETYNTAIAGLGRGEFTTMW